MGSALADGLLANEVDLRVWNRSADKCARYRELGVPVAGSLEDLAVASDVVVVCLTDHAASMEVLQSESVAECLSGKVLVLLTTMTAEESISTGKWAEENGVSYLEGSILAYPASVRSQTAMIVYAGSKNVFDSSLIVLGAMGGKPRLVGEQAGAAVQFDKAVYSSYYARAIGLLHGAAMCEASGASLDVFIEAILGPNNHTIDTKLLMRVRNRDFALDEASLDVHAAAYDMVFKLSERLGVSGSLPRVISRYFESARARGFGDSELAAVFEVLRQPG